MGALYVVYNAGNTEQSSGLKRIGAENQTGK